MLDIGFQELVIIFLVALLVFGPDRLPEVGRTLGKWIIEIRKGVQNARLQMETEFDTTDKKSGHDIAADMPEGGDASQHEGKHDESKEEA